MAGLEQSSPAKDEARLRVILRRLGVSAPALGYQGIAIGCKAGGVPGWRYVVVERRGCEGQPLHCRVGYAVSKSDRRRAFREAISIYRRVSALPGSAS